MGKYHSVLVWPARPFPLSCFVMLSFMVDHKTQRNKTGEGKGSCWPDYIVFMPTTVFMNEV